MLKLANSSYSKSQCVCLFMKEIFFIFLIFSLMLFFFYNYPEIRLKDLEW